MAIYHLHARAGSRGGGGRTGAGRVIKGKAAGQSARAKAAYNLRVQEYAANRHELAYVASGNLPSWAADDALVYWEATDTHERQKATLFREVEFALPHELPAAERHRLAHEFMASICDAQGLPYLLTVHEKPGNSHAHGLISERMHDGYDRTPETWFRRAANQGKEPGTGGARKARLGQDGSWLQSTRATWAAMCNGALELHGVAARIDHRSFADQGITDRLPQIHLGPHIAAMEARGIRTDRAEIAFEIARANAQAWLADVPQPRVEKRQEQQSDKKKERNYLEEATQNCKKRDTDLYFLDKKPDFEPQIVVKKTEKEKRKLTEKQKQEVKDIVNTYSIIEEIDYEYSKVDGCEYIQDEYANDKELADLMQKELLYQLQVERNYILSQIEDVKQNEKNMQGFEEKSSKSKIDWSL